MSAFIGGDVDLQSPWLAQLKSMDNAVARITASLRSQVAPVPEYGEGLPAEEDDLPDSSFLDELLSEIDSSGSGSSNGTGHPDGPTSTGLGRYDRAWLGKECSAYAARRRPPKMGPEELEGSLLSLLRSSSSNDELQAQLADILGFGDLDFVAELILHRKEIVGSASAAAAPQKKASPRGGGDPLSRLMTREQREGALRQGEVEHKSRPLGPQLGDQSVKYPHVYRAHDAGNTLDATGKKYSLPLGSVRTEKKEYEEIMIPATKVGTAQVGEKLVLVKDMDNLCSETFKGYKSLNRMQSLVYEVAYKTNENMLICAPTGAGKTDAAMLAILHTIGMNCSPPPREDPTSNSFFCHKDQFKIVYVAPMKALAAEIVEKLGKRLQWLDVEVRELTGDMHLTKAEIVKTQIIVTTPEKWDVVTRKSTGDTELVQKVRLLVIDEVHMLQDERGAVIESLVARTQRQVESTQSMIRIVGLSATLPNFVDVAEFLKVNPYAGLFYFDASFRPVPLEQHFIGVKGKAGTKESNQNLDRTTFEKVKEMLQQDHQVMVFVHTRRDTLKTAEMIHQMAIGEACTDLLDNTGHERYKQACRDMDRSRGRELRGLFKMGLGIHHAGMSRADRNLMERMFGDGLIKVLCCTATLAWGVNLPAAAVIIKGTQVYNPQKGKYMELGILDVLQIFGRAGRPQFQQYGIGFICTTHDKLAHYHAAVTQQHPIESRLEERIVDNLNAEIALGTVTSVNEGVEWLGYTYMFVRWKKNPLTYGIDWSELADDQALHLRRRGLILRAAKRLQFTQMVIFDLKNESLSPKDVGRIASNYYILNESIEMFNAKMKLLASEADVLAMISGSAEFKNIQSRDAESKELDGLRGDKMVCPCDMKGGTSESCVKVNILLQAYISNARLEDFALVPESSYVAQNSSRICRALFEIALNRRWGNLCQILLSICKSIEKRCWSYEHPLRQFNALPPGIVQKLEEQTTIPSIEKLRDMEPREIGGLVHNQGMGPRIAAVLDNFPTISVEPKIFPLSKDVLRIRLFLTPDFKWNERFHGSSESYWIWVEDSETFEIYHHEFVILTRRKLRDDHEINFTIPLSDPLPTQIYVRAISDRWLGAETVTPISFQHLIRPDSETVYTPLLDLQPLPITALKNETLERIYGSRFQYFNPMQTQIFHRLYHTSSNVLLGSPTGSGKTIACELAMWWAFREHPGSKVVYIAPMKALVRERVKDWTARLTGPMKLKLVELTGDNTPDTRTIRDADIIVTTPEKWDGISRSWQTRSYVRQVALVIIDEIHLLGGDRGPILEIIVSRMNYIASHTDRPVRLMGMSTACANASDLANWLGVKEGIYNFQHSVRPVPLEIYIDGFPGQQGFCPLMQSMNRPAFLAIKTHSPNKPVIIFVASRRQTRLTAKDIIAYCGLEDNPRRFLNMQEDELQALLTRTRDKSLAEALQFGVGLHHAGLVESDRQLVEELFTFNKIQILVATSTLAWGVNLPAHLVIVKGTQFFDAKTGGYKDMDLTDVLQMLGRAGRPQFDSSGIARIFTQEAKKSFYKYFLHRGFPVESSLHKVVDDHLGAEISAGTIKKKQDALDYLTWTFFFRRLHKNPTYYGLEIPPEEQDSALAVEEANKFLVDIVDHSVAQLVKSGCVTAFSNGDVETTALGKIASYYYLSHKTIRTLLRYAKKQATFEDCLLWMSRATEYDELPVRHNEDLINIELSKALPAKADSLGLPMWDPHVKAFLLIQAFMSRIELPISDYVTDQNSVLDQSIRILQAFIDVLAELGYLSSCAMMIKLMQCIKQARWPSSGAISILPGVNVGAAPAGDAEKSLLELASMPAKGVRGVMDRAHVPSTLRSSFIKTLSSIPTVEIATTSVTPSNLVVTLTRTNPPPTRSNDAIRTYAPRFPKPQAEGFFVILASSDELYALKRVSWPQRGNAGRNGGRLTAKVSLSLPPLPPGVTRAEGGGDGVQLVVLSDGYMGWERTIDVGLQSTDSTTTTTTTTATATATATATTLQDIPGAWVEDG